MDQLAEQIEPTLSGQIELSWRDAWRTEPRGRGGEWEAASGAVTATAQSAAPATPQAAGFRGPLASKVVLGGDPADWPEIAGALNSIPAPLAQRMAGTVGRIELHSSIPMPDDLGGEVQGSLAGLYTPGRHGWASEDGLGKGNGRLQIRTEPDIASTALHEAMHGLDEADGYPSDKLKWRLLCIRIRHEMGTRSAPEFQSNGTGIDSRRSAEELRAELAAQVLGGAAQFDLDPVRGGKVYHTGPRPILSAQLADEVRAQLAAEGITAPEAK